jgi:hypothetical protein
MKKKKNKTKSSLEKHALLDTNQNDPFITELMMDPALEATQDPSEYAHKAFVKMLLHLHKNLDKQ